MQQLLRTAIGELVDGHLFNQQFELFMDEALEPVIFDVASESLAELQIGREADALLDEVVRTETVAIVEELQTELQQQFVSEQQAADEAEGD